MDNLRTKGFVVLIEDDNDRRKRHIELTQKAEEAAKEMLEVHNDCKRIIMRYVTEEEKAVMDSCDGRRCFVVWMRNFKSNRVSLIRRKECSI